ncbi:MAG: hypothetical protein Fues2KO_32830 [Fuerstiella sp.]
MKIPAGWDIPVQLRVQLSDRSGRQRELLAEDHLVLVLHKVPAAGTRRRDAVYFWRSPSGSWRCTERGKPQIELQNLVSEYEAAVIRLGDLHETATSASEKFSVLAGIGPINRAARNLHDALHRASDGIESSDAVRELQPVCDLSGEVVREAELLQSDAGAALDFHIALQSETQASHSREVERATHRLNSIAALFLPLTAVASVFGMNLHSGLEDAPAWMFWFVVSISITGGFLISEMLTAFRLRKRLPSSSIPSREHP